jgi:hypothetical protein
VWVLLYRVLNQNCNTGAPQISSHGLLVPCFLSLILGPLVGASCHPASIHWTKRFSGAAISTRRCDQSSKEYESFLFISSKQVPGVPLKSLKSLDIVFDIRPLKHIETMVTTGIHWGSTAEWLSLSNLQAMRTNPFATPLTRRPARAGKGRVAVPRNGGSKSVGSCQ